MRLLRALRHRPGVPGLLSLATFSLAAVLPAAEGPTNPLLAEWQTPFGMPPFGEIRPEHFRPAYEEAMARQRAEIAAIVANPAPATFANTVVALEESGRLLDRVEWVFGGLTSAETNEALQAIDRDLAPRLSAHRDQILLDPGLIARLRVVREGPEGSALTGEDARLLERTWTRFARAGALLDPDRQARLRAINEELSSLAVSFGERVLHETNAFALVLENPTDLAGLPEAVVQAAAEAARSRGLSDRWVFTLHYPSIWPFLQYAENRALRQQLFTAYLQRGNGGGEHDTNRILARMAALRAERAQLQGYGTWADFILEDSMAGTPDRVYDLLNRLWEPAKRQAGREAEAMRAAIREDGHDFELQPWDWFYYAEKVRLREYDLDENEVRAYFELNRVRDAAFEAARRLYGISFRPLEGLPVYHPEVQAFEVTDADGSHLAVFLTDYHPRPGKQGGAWCGEYREQHTYRGQDVRPLVVNVCNFTRPVGDRPALLSQDEVETLFHEFGHGLHAMLQRIHYRSLGQVPRDFVELPSQIMENWAIDPAFLTTYARHWQTGAPIPPELAGKMRRAQRFNQGFANVEYLAASFLDLEWHTLAGPFELNPATLERIALAKIGLPSTIAPRYHSTYFRHIFDGIVYYSAGYYSYIWAEVLSCDAFHAFQETDLFDPATARSFRTNVLEKGGTADSMELYHRFRGRDPAVEPLLEKRGLQ